VWSDLLARGPEGWVTALFGVFAILIFVQYLGLNLLACIEARREYHRERLADRLSLFEGELAPPISLLVPAYNEEPTICDMVRSIMQLRYPSIEIIVVNDGSSDATLAVLTREFDLQPSARVARAAVPRDRLRGVYGSPRFPGLVVVDVVNGGSKSKAINVALAYARHPLVCVVDADSVLERDALLELALPFYQDAAVVATGGVVLPSNGSRIRRGVVYEPRVGKHPLARFQAVEYLRGMLIGRMGWDALDRLYIVSGALGLFSHRALMTVGGYRTETLGEDMELVMRLQRWAQRNGRARAVRFVHNAVAWTEVPERLKELAGQRIRWHQGLAESLWFNRGLFLSRPFSPRHTVAYVNYLLIELLGPFWEALGLVILTAQLIAGRVDGLLACLYLGVFVLGGTINTLVSIALETAVCPRYDRSADLLVLVTWALLENLGYRQLTTIWRLRALWYTLRRRREWGAISRLGHADTAEREARQAA
jgi:cellulose synthase/poly-beta-1,6-N-acetylglucosamine synthase-like glycosyltransferase